MPVFSLLYVSSVSSLQHYIIWVTSLYRAFLPNFLASLLFLLTLENDPRQDDSDNDFACPWEPYLNGKMLKFTCELGNYTTATKVCAAEGSVAQLLSIDSPEEDAFIVAFLRGRYPDYRSPLASAFIQHFWIDAQSLMAQLDLQNDTSRLQSYNTSSQHGMRAGTVDQCLKMSIFDYQRRWSTGKPCSARNRIICVKEKGAELSGLRKLLAQAKEKVKKARRKFASLVWRMNYNSYRDAGTVSYELRVVLHNSFRPIALWFILAAGTLTVILTQRKRIRYRMGQFTSKLCGRKDERKMAEGAEEGAKFQVTIEK